MSMGCCIVYTSLYTTKFALKSTSGIVFFYFQHDIIFFFIRIQRKLYLYEYTTYHADYDEN